MYFTLGYNITIVCPMTDDQVPEQATTKDAAAAAPKVPEPRSVADLSVDELIAEVKRLRAAMAAASI